MPARLLSAGWRGAFEGLGRWTLSPGAALRQPLLWPSTPRRLSLGCADHAKAPPGKKLLSEKKLVSLPAGRSLSAAPPTGRCFLFDCPVFVYSDDVIEGTQAGLENDDPEGRPELLQRLPGCREGAHGWTRFFPSGLWAFCTGLP